MPLIIWIRLRLHDLPSEQSHPLIVFITLLCFFFALLPQRAFMGCLVRCLRELIELVLSSAIGDDPIIDVASTVFRSEHHWALTTPPYQYTPKVIDLYLRTNLNFLVVFFILMPPPNSIDLTSSSSRALEFWTNTISSDIICCERNWYVPIPNVACITRDTILIMIPIVGRYEIPNDDLNYTMRSITSSIKEEY